MKLTINYETKCSEAHEEHYIQGPAVDTIEIIKSFCIGHPRASLLDFRYDPGDDEFIVDFETIERRIQEELVRNYYHGKDEGYEEK